MERAPGIDDTLEDSVMLRITRLAALLAVASLAASAAAQERAQPTTRPAGPGAQQLDAIVANCLLLGNQEEIALCRFALEKTKNEEVKELAQKYIDDHQEFAAKLRKHATQGLSFELRAESRDASGIKTAGGTREPAKVTPVEGTAPVRGTPGDANWLAAKVFQIERDAAQECLALSQECLGKQTGADFDKAFVGQQIGMHIGLLAKLNASENEVSPELQKVIREGQKTTKEHKQHAEKLMAQLATGRREAAGKNE